MTHAWLFTGPPGSGRSVPPGPSPPRCSARRGAAGLPELPPGAAAATPTSMLVRTGRARHTGSRRPGNWCCSAATVAGRRPLAGRAVRGLRPGHRGARRTCCSRPSRNPRRGRCGCCARRRRRTLLADDPVPVPAARAAHPAGRRGSRRAGAAGRHRAGAGAGRGPRRAGAHRPGPPAGHGRRRRERRAEVLRMPLRVDRPGPCLPGAQRLVDAAEEEAKQVAEEVDTRRPRSCGRRSARRPARAVAGCRPRHGRGDEGAGGPAEAPGHPGQAGHAWTGRCSTWPAFYRDVLAVQFGARVELGSAGPRPGVQRVAEAATPESTVRRIEAIMACRGAGTSTSPRCSPSRR